MPQRRTSYTPEMIAANALITPPLYKIARAIVRFLLHLLFHIEIEGAHYLQQVRGPLLVVANHLHWLDVPIVFALLPLRATAFAAEKWERHPFIGRLFRAIGNPIFVQRGEVDRRALAQALAVLRAGGVLGVAPEGTRSKTGALQPARGGAAYLAARTGATLLPIGIAGQEKAFRTLFRLRRPVIYVKVGAPFTLPGTPNQAKGEQLDAYTEMIMQTLADLLPPSYRGVYG
jgi:1-acyl-sn-glycerol-3-phosphate acyltransferase